MASLQVGLWKAGGSMDHAVRDLWTASDTMGDATRGLEEERVRLKCGETA